MTVVSDVAAVRANAAFTDDQKRAQIYQIKATALISALQTNNLIGRSYTFNGVVFTVTRQPVYHTDTRTLELWFTATRNGVPIPVSLPVLLVNPPVLVEAPNSTPTNRVFREDPLAALQQTFAGVVGA